MGIYSLIRDEGLGEFYNRRESTWIPGPPEDVSIEPSAFDGLSKKRGDEIETDVILDGIRCASCIWLIEKILLRTEGIQYARVNYATHKAKIRWNPEETDIRDILIRIKSIGYIPKPFVAKAHEEQLRTEQRDLLVRFGTAAFFSMQLMLYSIALYAGYFQGIGAKTKTIFQVISLFLTTPILFYSGMPLIKGSLRSMKNVSFSMDVLVVLGASSAYFYSSYQILAGGEVYFDTAAMIITLVLLGRYIETGAKGRASETIIKMLSLTPREARIIRDQDGIDLSAGQAGSYRGSGGSGPVDDGTHNALHEREIDLIPISSIKEDDLIQIQPGERIGLDGTVVEGSSEVDESMLTGESRPVAKTSGSEVFCGTKNLYGSFIFRVTRIGGDTVLSQIIKVVEDAQARRAPVQALADRIVGIFVPAVIVLSAITFFAWVIYVNDFKAALMSSISVLVIACPCALGLATPLAVLIGTTKGASLGILIKGGDIIERARNINTVVMDKTGTITEGRPELVSYKGIGITDKKVLSLASSLERFSEHSISRAIVNTDEDIKMYPVAGFAALPGKGIEGVIEGKRVLVGSRNFIESEGIFNNLNEVLSLELLQWIHSHEHSGDTVIYLSLEKVLSGIFIVSDTVRQEARGTVESLLGMGNDVIMITGDSSDTAAMVAGKVNLVKNKVFAERSPVEKAELIKEMQRAGRDVVMVGDGINDAPALIQADVGIALGRATDVAIESADMVLMKSDLNLIPAALLLSKKIYAIIRQNLFWAFFYNMVSLPLAVTGVLHPIVAALSMTLSSLCVVGNSMRLKKA
jgi:Cu2+-exporting ATPase